MDADVIARAAVKCGVMALEEGGEGYGLWDRQADVVRLGRVE
jgi:hypothetical protein